MDYKIDMTRSNERFLAMTPAERFAYCEGEPEVIGVPMRIKSLDEGPRGNQTDSGNQTVNEREVMTQAIIYARFSPCPGSDENLSNEKQVDRCLAYCFGRKYEVVAIHKDDAVSGTQLERPGLNEAIEGLADGEVLVVDRSDRLARDVVVDLTIRARVKAAGAKIEFADGSPNVDTPEGTLISTMFAAIAQFERDRISARTSSGLRRKQANGEWLGRPPIGFRVDRETKRLVEDTKEQAAIKSAVCWSSNGESSEGIARILTSMYGPFRGKPWSARTVRKIIAKNQ